VIVSRSSFSSIQAGGPPTASMIEAEECTLTQVDIRKACGFVALIASNLIRFNGGFIQPSCFQFVFQPSNYGHRITNVTVMGGVVLRDCCTHGDVTYANSTFHQHPVGRNLDRYVGWLTQI
jgi:hypothetical protein